MTLQSDAHERPGTDAKWPPIFNVPPRHMGRLEFASADRSAVEFREERTTLPKPISIASEEEATSLREQLRCLMDQANEREAQQNLDAVKARQAWQEELSGRVRQEREAVATWLDGFSLAKRRYFSEVETEVVKLALAIAARILHREALFDPLLLQGAVRVALEQITDTTAVSLRVAAEDLSNWQESGISEKSPHLQIIVDEGLRAGECVLDTHMGRVELGAAAQLAEIERGFFDLLQKRPA